MSSILDAVTRDAAHSGSIPGAAGGAPAQPPGAAGGSGPGRFRSAVIVVVFGVAVGALAARLLGGGQPADDLLTEKVASRPDAKASAEAARAAVGGSTDQPRKKGKDEDAHAKIGGRKKDAPVSVAPVHPADAGPAPSAPTLVIPAPSAPANIPQLAVVTPAAPPAVLERPVPPAAREPAVPPALAEPAAPPAPVLVTGAASAPTPGVVAGVAEPLPSAVAAVVAPPASVEPSAQPESPAVAGDAGDVAVEEVAPEAVLYEKPADAPEVSILFVAWSRTPADRMVSMRVGSGSLSVVHEGEYVEGLQISAIHPEAVDFQWTGQKFRVPIRPF